MEINSNNLINKDILNTKKFDDLKTDGIDDEKKLREISNDFESFFINQIMDVSLRNTNIAGEEAGSDIVKSMYIQAISDASSGTFGISDMLFEFLSKNNK
ncbi:putative flagellar rod assembly protein FlgJ [Aliarcobacter faecis]|uniref:rod-binding protein n=1 Tax=Aliarcobacter faecis TaxID=1564138 RepID=UPI00047B973C|nr:rod-binding protein [Aliarcobacter faecis]QKF72589.1 putative flagellar rod assembly protein FlgJ [Aliarcobacter faecis]